MRHALIVLAVCIAACQGRPAGKELRVGDVAPAEIGVDSSTNLLLVTTSEDCFSCRIHHGFVALRTALRAEGFGGVPRVTALLVVGPREDTVSLSNSLENERIAAQIKTISSKRAKTFFDLERLPAIFLVDQGRIVREWTGLGWVGADVRRTDIADALVQVAHSKLTIEPAVVRPKR